jgi:PDZ domain
MKRLLLTILLSGSTTLLLAAQPAAQAGKTKDGSSATTPASKQTYLGLTAEALSPAMSSQLPGIVPLGQGVLVGNVAKGSPAANAGLQAYDILLSFGDQKLFSPEQLAKLIHGDRPNHEIAMTFARGGKLMSAKVTLGETERPMTSEADRVFRFFPEGQHVQQMFKDFESANKDDSGWESFDGMKLSRLDDKHWKAEIEYRSKDGKKDAKSFSGTREEIRKDIDAQKDLPVNERRHLLRALNLHDPIFEFHVPRWDSIRPQDQ